MIQSHHAIRYVNGKRLSKVLIAGVCRVITQQDKLNAINVFPVADKDTGTNLAVTLNGIPDAVQSLHQPNLPELLHVIADSCLDNSRGNSGVIFAQFFVGLAEAATTTLWHATELARALDSGLQRALSAVTEPMDGTVLSVMSTFVNTFSKLALDKNDLLASWQGSLKRASNALTLTTKSNKACRVANVVDAGAQGFFNFLEGIDELILHGASHQSQNITPNNNIEVNDTPDTSHSHQNSKYRFCTECIVSGNDINLNQLKEDLMPCGDSLIVAGHSTKTKIHIHTNDPNHVFNICRQVGQTKKEKADDMNHQQISTKGIAILTDSSADFPESFIDDYHIHVIPLIVNFGDESFKDKLSITPTQFYKKMAASKIHPTSSQPAMGEFRRMYHYLSEHYDSIIAIHLPEKHSGTLQSSRLAAKQHTRNDINTSFIDSGTVSGGAGLVVRLAAKAIHAGYSHNDVVDFVKKYQSTIKQFAIIPNLFFAVSGGRLAPWKYKLITFLRRIPILSFNDKRKVKVSRAVKAGDCFPKRFAAFICKQLMSNKQYHLLIEHCDNLKGAIECKSFLEKQLNNLVSCEIIEASSVLGIHAGPGAIGIAFQEDIIL